MKDNKPTITEDAYPDGCVCSALPGRDHYVLPVTDGEH